MVNVVAPRRLPRSARVQRVVLIVLVLLFGLYLLVLPMLDFDGEGGAADAPATATPSKGLREKR